MISLNTVESTTFSTLNEKQFLLETASAGIALMLEQVRELGNRRPDGPRDPFALSFRGQSGIRLPQGIYRLSHSELGSFEIFVTQNADGPKGSEFEAIFN
jgi:hypothetical protein